MRDGGVDSGVDSGVDTGVDSGSGNGGVGDSGSGSVAAMVRSWH